MFHAHLMYALVVSFFQQFYWKSVVGMEATGVTDGKGMNDKSRKWGKTGAEQKQMRITSYFKNMICQCKMEV